MLYIEDMDEAVMLRNHRAQFEALRQAAESGSMGDFTVYYGGNYIDVWSTIGAGPIREAIIAECDKELAKNMRALDRIGVNTAPKLINRAND